MPVDGSDSIREKGSGQSFSQGNSTLFGTWTCTPNSACGREV